MTFSVNGTTVITTDRIVNLTTGATGSRPASPVIGQLFFDTTLGKMIVWNGATWQQSRSEVAPDAWAWGKGSYGNLGSGNTIQRTSPVSVVGFTDWKQITPGSQHSAGLRANGQAWCFGRNHVGQLGDGTTTTGPASPVSVVGGFTDWIQIDAGGFHTLGLRTNGQVWAWGSNTSGQLGDGTTTSRLSPVSVVGGFTNWKQISAGRYNNAGIRTNGQAWCWGLGGKGANGNNNNQDQSSPVSVAGGITDWAQISAGDEFVIAIRANGLALSWGNNTKAQLGDGDPSKTDKSSPVSVVGGFTNWVQVSAAVRHSAGIRANGQAWCWGYNLYGNLGNGNSTDQSSPVSVVGGFTDWVQISAGGDHTAAVRANGQAWAWGRNLYGNLGDGTTTNRSSPISVVGGFTDWVQIGANVIHTTAIRSQPRTQTVTPTNQRKTLG